MTRRASLRFIILAATEQDVKNCMACQTCYADEALEDKFDMPLWRVLAAARTDDESALTNRTIWVLAGVSPNSVRCTNGLDVLAIARVLRQEARRRGLAQTMVK